MAHKSFLRAGSVANVNISILLVREQFLTINGTQNQTAATKLKMPLRCLGGKCHTLSNVLGGPVVVANQDC